MGNYCGGGGGGGDNAVQLILPALIPIWATILVVNFVYILCLKTFMCAAKFAVTPLFRVCRQKGMRSTF